MFPPRCSQRLGAPPAQAGQCRTPRGLRVFPPALAPTCSWAFDTLAPRAWLSGPLTLSPRLPAPHPLMCPACPMVCTGTTPVALALGSRKALPLARAPATQRQPSQMQGCAGTGVVVATGQGSARPQMETRRSGTAPPGPLPLPTLECPPRLRARPTSAPATPARATLACAQRAPLGTTGPAGTLPPQTACPAP